MTTKTDRLWKNEYIQALTVVILLVIAIFGLIYGAQVFLHTKTLPVFIVSTGSMCVPYDGACDGWSHPFARTLHEGDILIIIPVNPKDLKTDYPNSDIIVYNTAEFGRIVHRIVATTTINGQLAFYTKGDGNGQYKWPAVPPTSEYDPWSPILANQIVGKVVLRIPWVGHITLFLQSLSSGNSSKVVVPVIIILIIILLVIEFAIPLMRRKKPLSEVQEKIESNN